MALQLVTPLDSERLVLRGVQHSDLADLLRMNGDDAVTRFLPYETWVSRADGEAWIARMSAMTAAGGGLQLVIVEKTSHSVVGTCLLFRYDQASARAEIGYALAREWWGRGIMREALSALIGHAFGACELHRVEAEVDPDNRPSNAVLASLGFTCEGRLRQRWVAKGRRYDTHVYGLLREEWAGRP